MTPGGPREKHNSHRAAGTKCLQKLRRDFCSWENQDRRRSPGQLTVPGVTALKAATATEPRDHQGTGKEPEGVWVT